MATLARKARSWVTATADTVAVFGVTVVLLFPVTAAVGDTVGVSSGPVSVATGVVAFGATYRFVAGEWSMGTLGEYFFAFVVATIGLLAGSNVLLGADTVGVSARDPVVRVVVWAVVSLTAYAAVTSGATRRVLDP